MKPKVQPLKDTLVGSARRSLWFLFGSVCLLLLIACVNVAALLLARATTREHEISIRFALGAGRGAVIAQLLTEAFLIALVGAALGLGVAAGASRVFQHLARSLPRVEEIHLDWRVVAYSGLVAGFATLACGLFPALRITRRGISESLAQAGRTQVSGRNPLQLALVGIQVALAVALLSAAGLLVRSFQELARVAPGFEINHVLTFHISGSYTETADMKRVSQRVDRTLDFLRSVPGVEQAATSMTLPGVRGGYPTELHVLEGRAESEPKIVAMSRFVSPGYFATLGIPVLEGEVCREDPMTVVVNRSFVDKYFPGVPVLGHHLRGSNAFLSPPSEIGGVVADAREEGLNREPEPIVYWCFSAPDPHPNYLVRTRVEPMDLAQTIRRKMREIEPGRSVFDIMPLASHIDDTFAENRLRTVLLLSFAVTALLLACVGLYGTLSYLVRVREREIGLRLALGALPGQLVRHFLGQGLAVAALGCAAGLALASAFSRVLAGMLYGVSPADLTTLSGVVLLMLGVTGLASLAPALRAARVEPMQVLREE